MTGDTRQAVLAWLVAEAPGRTRSHADSYVDACR